MKRVILLGVAVLFAASMAMAADVIFDADATINGDYSGDYIHIAVNANANVDLDGNVVVNNLAVCDTQVGAIGTLTIDAGYQMDVTGYVQCGIGSMGVVNIEGTMNVTGHYCFDGNATLSGSPGVYAQLNVSGDGLLQTGAHTIWGGYNANYQCDVTISGNATVEGGLKPFYIGGTQGNATCTMSGSAKLQNTDGDTGYYDNMLNIGWDNPGTEGKLIVESGNTVKFRHVTVRSYGTVEFILDAAGAACVLTSELQANEDPGDCFVFMATGSILDVKTAGVAGGILVPGFAVDLATAPEEGGLQWDTPGTYEPTLLVDGAANAMWGLREKPGDATTLQAYIIPEPATMALLGLGGLLVAMRRRS